MDGLWRETWQQQMQQGGDHGRLVRAYVGHVLIRPRHGRVHHPGCVGTRAGLSKIRSVKESPGSHLPAGPGSQAWSLFASFSQRQRDLETSMVLLPQLREPETCVSAFPLSKAASSAQPCD